MNKNIIELELPENLQDAKIVTEFIFETNTKNFVLELNDVYDNTRIIFHYNKNWTIIKRNLRREAKAKYVQEQHIKLFVDALDANYNTVTMTQINYDQQDGYIKDQQGQVKKESTRGEKMIYTINKYSQGIPLAESILIDNKPFFIQIIDGKPVISPKIQLSDIIIEPPERTEYLSKEYSFQSEEEVNHFIELAKKERLDSLYDKVKSFWKKFVDIDEDFINICTADTIFTHFQDRMGMTHYLWIVGDNNTGKSNVLLVFSYLGYRAIYDTSITPANIYNFGSQLEEGQCIIIEDEVGDIDDQIEKKKMYQVSYRSGTKVTRMYENNNSSNNNKRKSSRQQSFFMFCFKVFASEKMPDKIKSKGFIERLIPLKSLPGNPHFDISEVVNDAGDEQFKELYQELIDIRKLLLMYRLLHYNDLFPNIKLNIKNRYKQLTKPLIRLFQNTKAINEIIKSLSKYLIEKNQKKMDSFDSSLLTLVIDLVAENGTILYNERIWEELKVKYPSGKIEGKPYSWYIEDNGIVSKTKITSTCETKFGAKEHRDREKGRGLIFNQDTLNKLSTNYSIIEGIKIIQEDKDQEQEDSSKKNGDTYDKGDTFREDIDQNGNNSSKENSKDNYKSTSNDEEKIQENDNSGLKISENIDKYNGGHSTEVSLLSPLSLQSQNILTTLTPSQQSNLSKIKTGLFINPLISESDLLLEDYDYDHKIINSIYRFEGNDHWFCKNCAIKGDKWFMMKHPCNNINNNK